MKQRLGYLILWAMLTVVAAPFGWLLAWALGHHGFLACYVFTHAVVTGLGVPLLIVFQNTQKAKVGLRSFDEMLSAVMFGGPKHFSLSAWAWKQYDDHWWAWCIVTVTDLIQPGHCETAYLEESIGRLDV